MGVTGFIAGRLRFRGNVAVISIALSFLVMIIAVSVSSGFRKEIRDALSSAAGDIQLVPSDLDWLSGNSPIGSHPSYLPYMDSIRGVKSVSPVVYRAGIVRNDDVVHGVLFKGVEDFHAPDSVSLDVTRNYFEGLFVLDGEEDEFSPFLERRDPRLLLAVLKELARNISSEAGLQTMASSLRSSGDWPSLDVDTFARYKKILEDLFLVYDMPSWNKNLRSTVVTRRAPVRHFFDPSIAIASLGAAPADLLSDIRSFGLFFEDLAVRDLAVYADCLGASLKHYRDSSGLEVDAIVELRNGRYGAIEVKVASPENVEKAASSLLRFERRMDEIGSERPSFRMVLTTNGACYRRADRTYVVPITCLRD